MAKSTAPRASDAFDRRILKILQNDASLAHAEIGNLVGLSASAVRRRIEVLKERGAIRKIVAMVDPAMAGDGTNVVVMLTFERESPDVYAEFERRICAAPEVAQCHILSGQFDVLLVVVVATPEEYWAWAERTLTSDPLIKRYDSFIVWSTLKFKAAPLPSRVADHVAN